MACFHGAIVEENIGREELPVNRSPSCTELGLFWLFAVVLFLLVLTHFRPYAAIVDAFGDNERYLWAANAIRRWDFHGVTVKQFWGLPYVIACFSWLPMSARSILLLICAVSSLVSLLLAWHLWGPWIAGFFTVLNFYWIQLSLLGGSEPLFVVLLFSAFWAIRKERWLAASVLAAFATVVRPLGVFALLGIGLALIVRRDYKKLLACTSLATLVGTLYLLPFWIYFHDPLYQVHRYQQSDWQSESAISLPFRAIISSLFNHQVPWTNVLLTLGWIIFAFSYLLFLFSYNSGWARAEFPRFAMPVVPFLLLAFDRWLPRSRYVLYGLGIASSVLGACSAIGIREVMATLR